MMLMCSVSLKEVCCRDPRKEYSLFTSHYKGNLRTTFFTKQSDTSVQGMFCSETNLVNHFHFSTEMSIALIALLCKQTLIRNTIF
jgi:hypothetical protein